MHKGTIRNLHKFCALLSCEMTENNKHMYLSIELVVKSSKVNLLWPQPTKQIFSIVLTCIWYRNNSGFPLHQVTSRHNEKNEWKSLSHVMTKFLGVQCRSWPDFFLSGVDRYDFEKNNLNIVAEDTQVSHLLIYFFIRSGQHLVNHTMTKSLWTNSQHGQMYYTVSHCI